MCASTSVFVSLTCVCMRVCLSVHVKACKWEGLGGTVGGDGCAISIFFLALHFAVSSPPYLSHTFSSGTSTAQGGGEGGGVTGL